MAQKTETPHKVAEEHYKGNGKLELKLKKNTHRRILNFLNEAVQPEDLVYEKKVLVHTGPHDEHNEMHEDNPDELHKERKTILDYEIAKELIEFRDREYPLGFRHIREVLDLKIFDRKHLDVLWEHFSDIFYGNWSTFPVDIPRRGPGGYDGIVHAALLHTGKVLFITADETTLLWDPNDTTAATFEDPVNQPHQIPNATEGYSILCGGHSFLSDGRLMVVGGGGYGPNSKAKWGYKFDPVAKTWSRTANSMTDDRWYPTVLTLGDQRIGNSHELLVVCGHGGGDMEIYDEGSDSFREITSGDNKPFPALYPGLHLLPNHTIFYSRTGWGSAGPGGGNYPGDDQSAYFALTGQSTGVWNNIASISPTKPDRTKGMSVMLLSNTAPYVRILSLGGSNSTNNNTYEIIDATALSAVSDWGPSSPFPDNENRSLCSGVLLPDGNVFVCGGIQRVNSPCTMFNAQTNSWSAMDELPSIRDYHSAAILLPDATVMMAGWNNTKIEIFKPPYLFRGARPVIANAPRLVHHGQTFEIEVPDACDITKVVFVRPMAITHQTDTEQKVLNIPYFHDHHFPEKLKLTAPHGGHPHSLAQQGYYMMFVLNHHGVPSIATWIYLH